MIALGDLDLGTAPFGPNTAPQIASTNGVSLSPNLTPFTGTALSTTAKARSPLAIALNIPQRAPVAAPVAAVRAATPPPAPPSDFSTPVIVGAAVVGLGVIAAVVYKLRRR